jgi:hypothetical protein
MTVNVGLFYGDWMKIQASLKKIDSDRVVEKSEKQMGAIGRELTRKLKSHIRNQDLDWAPLSSASIKKKGFDQIYVDRGDYLRSITYDVTVENGTIKLNVYPEGDHYSGLSMQELADYLEYGTAKIRARPLWRPVFSEIESMRSTRSLLSDFESVAFEGMG